MPGITLFVQNLSQFLMTRYIEIIIGLGITGGALWYAITKTPQGGKIFDIICFNSPVLGDLLKKFSFLDSSILWLLSYVAVYPVFQALQIYYQSITNGEFRKLITDIMDAIKGGGSYTDGLKKNKHIVPPIVQLMFSIGEETGSMEVV